MARFGGSCQSSPGDLRICRRIVENARLRLGFCGFIRSTQIASPDCCQDTRTRGKMFTKNDAKMRTDSGQRIVIKLRVVSLYRH